MGLQLCLCLHKDQQCHHSVVQNGRRGGQLRSPEFPEGVPPIHPEAALGNQLWEAALIIFEVCWGEAVILNLSSPLGTVG